jgi:hypothetical protein
MRPLEGTISPEMRRKNVVLPAPLGPMMARSSPAFTAKSTWWTAARLPKLRLSFAVSRMRSDMG